MTLYLFHPVTGFIRIKYTDKKDDVAGIINRIPIMTLSNSYLNRL